MNSTSLEPRHSQHSVSTLPASAQEATAQQNLKALAVNLSSSPKSSFRAPTAEDFDRGARPFADEPVSRPAGSIFAMFWSKLLRHER
ncbi:hypothetical protein C9383_15345 [Pseudomonas palleroniana]|uniref:Uncharacterized protein n=1 Tax=Pseudomonas palleroniana TaxID=191390 RepID=A0A2T4FQV6_9PSED|nr:hypothetical protein F7R03_24555 [Pseudomonas palleroniana]PTC25738.1 hypothetical protein C9383_15345 [Pseudomonas palleroniana]